MIVADTSPLNYLILIDAVEILPALFQEVVIPNAVRQELLAVGAEEKVRKRIENAPHWLKIEKVGKIDKSINLGVGEVEAISLAIELSADLILLDDRAARLAAKERNLKMIGTLGILKLAGENKLIDFEISLKNLRKTNFRISKFLLKELLDRYK